jgi:hypothetical protein
VAPALEIATDGLFVDFIANSNELLYRRLEEAFTLVRSCFERIPHYAFVSLTPPLWPLGKFLQLW